MSITTLVCNCAAVVHYLWSAEPARSDQPQAASIVYYGRPCGSRRRRVPAA